MGALASVADVQPDLMLLDILLTHMAGYQVCHAIRHHLDKHDLASLPLSGNDSVVDRLRRWLAGSTDYICKPFDPAELVWPVKRYQYTRRLAVHSALCATRSTDAESLSRCVAASLRRSARHRAARRSEHHEILRSGSPISCKNERISRYDWSMLVS
jgi:DNA-binding response OmpR family regulator